MDINSDGEDGKPPFNFEEFIFKYRFTILILLIGILLIGSGILFMRSKYFKKTSDIEILQSKDDSNISEQLVVEIAGAIEKPGVYKLPNGARVEDLLIASGGLSSDADREVVERTINRAAKLTDGQKIFIPEKGKQTLGATANLQTGGSAPESGNYSVNIGGTNINTASQKQLEALPGIGPVYAQNIIEQRPYSTVEELLSRSVLKKSVYEKIKDMVLVY